MGRGQKSPSLLPYISNMILKESVKQIVEDYIAGTEYYLVDANVTPDNHITVEVDNFDGVSIDYCIELNRHIESKLDRESEDFELEVSSAGLTSPFKVRKQYEKNIGNEVEVLTKDGKKITGTLVAVADDEFTVDVEKQVKLEGAKRKTTVVESIVFSYERVKTTKYIFRFK